MTYTINVWMKMLLMKNMLHTSKRHLQASNMF